MKQTALVCVPRAGLDIAQFAAAAGLHPELVRRLVTLGLLETIPNPPGAGGIRFAPAQLEVAARIQRLRAGLGMNYASIGLVLQLLDRIDHLESTLRQQTKGSSWTSTV
jgi:chaperone modulatory protein CbpM